MDASLANGIQPGEFVRLVSGAQMANRSYADAFGMLPRKVSVPDCRREVRTVEQEAL